MWQVSEARFRKLIEAEDYLAAIDVALEQVRGGANLLDVNMDADLLDSERAMTTRYLPVGRIGKDQAQDYALRRGLDLAEIERWLCPNLAYEPTYSGGGGKSL